MKTAYFIFLMALSLWACKPKPQAAEPAIQGADKPKDLYSYKFKGTLPCADCPGIVTELGFYDDSLNYVEKTTYLERPNSFERKGSYTIVKGYKANPNVLIFVLDDETEDARNYLKVNDSTLLLLDKQREIIDTSERFQLHQVNRNY